MQITIDAGGVTSASRCLRKAAGVLHAPHTCKHILVTADAGELRLEATHGAAHAREASAACAEGIGLAAVGRAAGSRERLQGRLRITNGLVGMRRPRYRSGDAAVSDWPQMLAPFDEAKRWSMPAPTWPRARRVAPVPIH